MIKLRGSWAVPFGTFCIAVAISLLAGPPSSVIGLRRQAHPTSGEECKITCIGNASPGDLRYKPTDFAFIVPKGLDPMKSAEEVAKDLAAIKSNADALKVIVNCPDEVPPLKEVKTSIYPASVLSASAGPSIWAYARGTAELAVLVSKDKTHHAMLLQTGKLNVADASLEPLEEKTKGNLTSTVQVTAGPGSKVVSYGTAHGLATGGAAIRDHIDPQGATARGILLTVLDQVVGFLVDKLKLAGPIGGILSGMITKLFKIGLELDCQAEYRLKGELNGGTFGGTTQALIADRHDEAGAEVGARTVKGGNFIGGSLQAPGDPHRIEVSYEANSLTKARAVGVRGDGYAANVNLWGYAIMMCCSHPDFEGMAKEFTYAQDAASFDPKDKPVDVPGEKAGDAPEVDLKGLTKFEDLKSTFRKVHAQGTKAAADLLKENKCEEAKKVLEQMHGQLKAVVDSGLSGSP